MEPEEIARLLGVMPETSFTERYRPRYNVAPTDEHWIVRAAGGASLPRRELVPAAWGVGKGHQILTRAENARTRTMLRDPSAGHRCVVPADGFFEWTGDKGDRRPIWFHRPDRSLVLLAAMCVESQGGFQFSILTTTPNAVVEKVHDRMPVVVPLSDVGRFLSATDPKEVASFLKAAPDDALVAEEVSKRVNVVGNDDPDCLAPPEPKRESTEKPRGKQLRLF